MRLGVVLVAVLLAGCSGLGGLGTGDGGSTSTAVATPAPVPTDQSVAYPPGVSEAGVNATALAAAHERQLRGASYAWEFDAREVRPEPGLGSVYVGPSVVVETASPRRYVIVRRQITERGGGLVVETDRRVRFASGERVLTTDGNGTRSRNVTDDDAALGARLAGRLVAQHLAVENASVRLFTNGTARIEGRGTLAVEGTNYELTAYVDEVGVVRRFDAAYVRDDRVQFARYELRLEQRRVTPPPSVLNRTETDA